MALRSVGVANRSFRHLCGNVYTGNIVRMGRRSTAPAKAPMADLIVDFRLEGENAVVSATGEIDVYQAPRLREVLDALPTEATGALVIDLSGVSYIDSTGLGTLVAARKQRVSEGSTVRFVCPDPSLRKVFEITGLVSYFTLVDTVEAALAMDSDSD